MELERLNTSQIVLLTLLVSFVTSIATGIVTVTLMEQAPPIVAQTVNRVVERTVERIVPSGQPASAATVTEKTVIVKETDRIATALETIKPSIVRLHTTSKDPEGKDVFVFLGFGLIVTSDGLLLTDVATLPASGGITIERDGGEMVAATSISTDATTGLSLLQGATSTDQGPIAWKPARFVSTPATLGKVVIGISGKSNIRIGDGIVTATPETEGTSPHVMETNIPIGAIAFGSALINSDGDVEGMSTLVSRATSENSFLASESIIVYTMGTKEPTVPLPGA